MQYHLHLFYQMHRQSSNDKSPAIDAPMITSTGLGCWSIDYSTRWRACLSLIRERQFSFVRRPTPTVDPESAQEAKEFMITFYDRDRYCYSPDIVCPRLHWKRLMQGHSRRHYTSIQKNVPHRSARRSRFAKLLEKPYRDVDTLVDLVRQYVSDQANCCRLRSFENGSIDAVGIPSLQRLETCPIPMPLT